MSITKKSPTSLDTRTGKQNDDNIDDLGRHPDGSREDQPVNAGSSQPASGDKSKPAAR